MHGWASMAIFHFRLSGGLLSGSHHIVILMIVAMRNVLFPGLEKPTGGQIKPASQFKAAAPFWSTHCHTAKPNIKGLGMFTPATLM